MRPDCSTKLTLKNSLLALSVFGVIFIGAKTFASGNHGEMDHSKMHDTKPNDSDRKVIDGNTKKRVMKALKVNESLHQAFFKYDAQEAALKAKELKTAIEKIENKEVAKLLSFAKSKLDNIKASSDREENNKNYHIVSSALIHVVNTYDLGNEYNAYSCPMVKKKWLQNTSKSSDVKNPYAASMPSCGSKDSKY